jgi:MoxR-like ATPase
MSAIADVDQVIELLSSQHYVADRRLATAVFLALRLQRPLLLEGEAGVGKTELAKALAAALDAPLIRLQCYEGLDVTQAAYEWNVPRQMLEIRLAEAAHESDRGTIARSIYRRDMLVERPLLAALVQPRAPVLLIDELDRADEPFEAFLLEVLSDFQITIPEFGTIKAKEPPIVVLTSNRTREIHDAVKRRCLYHWVDYPDAERERAILERRVPRIGPRLAQEIVAFVQRLRALELYKLPGIAETIEWARALMELDSVVLDPAVLQDTLGVLLKYQDDIARVQGSQAEQLLAEVRRQVAGAA